MRASFKENTAAVAKLPLFWAGGRPISLLFLLLYLSFVVLTERLSVCENKKSMKRKLAYLRCLLDV